MDLQVSHRISAETATGEQVLIENVAPGRKLVLALEDAGVDILHRCGGVAKCTTCRVDVLAGDPGEIGEAERNVLATKADLSERTRLSCQIRVNDDLTVKVARQASVENIAAGGRPAE